MEVGEGYRGDDPNAAGQPRLICQWDLDGGDAFVRVEQFRSPSAEQAVEFWVEQPADQRFVLGLPALIKRLDVRQSCFFHAYLNDGYEMLSVLYSNNSSAPDGPQCDIVARLGEDAVASLSKL